MSREAPARRRRPQESRRFGPRRALLPAPYDLAWSGVALALFAGALIYPFLNRETGAALPPCVFKSVTEVPCATCGASRSMIAFSRGSVAESLRMNPLVGMLCLFSLGVILYTLGVRLFGVRRFRLRLPPAGGWIYPVAIPSLILLNWAFLVIAGR